MAVYVCAVCVCVRVCAPVRALLRIGPISLDKHSVSELYPGPRSILSSETGSY